MREWTGVASPGTAFANLSKRGASPSNLLRKKRSPFPVRDQSGIIGVFPRHYVPRHYVPRSTPIPWLAKKKPAKAILSGCRFFP